MRHKVTKLHKALGYAAAAGGLLAVSPLSAFAQAAGNINLGLPSGSKFSSVTTYTPTGFAQSAINFLLVAAGLVAFFWLLVGGVQWIMAGGDKEGTEKARKRITAALIGLAIVFSVFALVQILQGIFGVDLLNLQYNFNLSV